MTNCTPIATSRKPTTREMASIPDSPRNFMMRPELCRAIQKISAVSRVTVIAARWMNSGMLP